MQVSVISFLLEITPAFSVRPGTRYAGFLLL
jgi:hypothetical protein